MALKVLGHSKGTWALEALEALYLAGLYKTKLPLFAIYDVIFELNKSIYNSN